MKSTYQVLISRRQLAIRWGCSIPTIKRREKAGFIPVAQLGGNLVRYKLADIEACEAGEAPRVEKAH